MFSTLHAPPTEAERQARRSNAPALQAFTELLHRDPPGPPTDDRWQQSNHFTGVIYLAICAIAKALAGSTLRVMKRRSEPVFRSKKSRRLERQRLALGGTIRKASSPLSGQEHHDDELVEAPRSNQFVRLFGHINQNDTLGDFLTGWVTQRNLTGTAFNWGRVSQLGWAAPPAELYILPTALMSSLIPAQYQGGAYPYGAWQMFPFSPGGSYGMLSGMFSGAGAILDGREVKRHRKYHPLFRWDGYSPLTAGGVNFDVVESIAQSWKAAMDHGFRPDGIVTIKGATEDVMNLTAAAISQPHAGSRNHNRLVVTNGEGVSFDKFFTEPRQMDYDKGWDNNIKFALAMLGVMPAVAGIAEATSYSQLFASLKQFYTNTLGPEAREISQFLTKQWVVPFEPDTVVQIAVPEIDDKDYDLKKQDMMNKYGLQTVDEARGWAGKEPLEEGKGGDELVGKGGGMDAMGGAAGGVDPNDGEAQLADILGQSGASGGPPQPKNAAGAGSLPGRGIVKSRLRQLVDSLG